MSSRVLYIKQKSARLIPAADCRQVVAFLLTLDQSSSESLRVRVIITSHLSSVHLPRALPVIILVRLDQTWPTNAALMR